VTPPVLGPAAGPVTEKTNRGARLSWLRGDDGMYAWIVDLEVDGDRVTKLDSFPDSGD
jgi:hypothetical protein